MEVGHSKKSDKTWFSTLLNPKNISFTCVSQIKKMSKNVCKDLQRSGWSIIRLLKPFLFELITVYWSDEQVDLSVGEQTQQILILFS